MTTPQVIYKATDVTPAILEDAVEVLDWFGDGPIDWELFIDRMADYGSQPRTDGQPTYDFEHYDSPAVRKIQRHVRELRNA